jgi:putative hydrolase of the HAD superfamily
MASTTGQPTQSDRRFDVIAFDADDTLWHNEGLYSGALDRLKHILSAYPRAATVDGPLHAIEVRNLSHFGYGIKAYVLALIEAAIQVTGGTIRGQDIQKVIDLGREMIDAPIQLMEHVKTTLATLSEHYPLMLITKGDLFEQETRIGRSGLKSYFAYIEITSDKTAESYTTILAKYRIDPHRFLMVGNSHRSDILPVLALGGYAVYIPYPFTWAHEVVDDPPAGHPRYFELEHLGLLPALIEQIG